MLIKDALKMLAERHDPEDCVRQHDVASALSGWKYTRFDRVEGEPFEGADTGELRLRCPKPERLWGSYFMGPEPAGVVLTSMQVIHDPRDLEYMNGFAWIEFVESLYPRVALNAWLCLREPYPLRVWVPQRQNFTIDAYDVRKPMELVLTWERRKPE